MITAEKETKLMAAPMPREQLMAVDFDDIDELPKLDQAWWYHFRAHPEVLASSRHQHGRWPLPECASCGHHHVNPDDWCQETIPYEHDDAACGCSGWEPEGFDGDVTLPPAQAGDPPF